MASQQMDDPGDRETVKKRATRHPKNSSPSTLHRTNYPNEAIFWPIRFSWPGEDLRTIKKYIPVEDLQSTHRHSQSPANIIKFAEVPYRSSEVKKYVRVSDLPCTANSKTGKSTPFGKKMSDHQNFIKTQKRLSKSSLMANFSPKVAPHESFDEVNSVSLCSCQGFLDFQVRTDQHQNAKDL
jgi:hypothetical protein